MKSKAANSLYLMLVLVGSSAVTVGALNHFVQAPAMSANSVMPADVVAQLPQPIARVSKILHFSSPKAASPEKLPALAVQVVNESSSQRGIQVSELDLSLVPQAIVLPKAQEMKVSYAILTKKPARF